MRRFAVVGLGVILIALGSSFPLSLSSARASDSSSATTTSSRPLYGKVDEAQIALARPLPARAAYGFLPRATALEPLELRFRSGSWTGGIVVSGDTAKSRELVKIFLASSPAASGESPIYAIGASAGALRGQLADVPGERTHRDSLSSGPSVVGGKSSATTDAVSRASCTPTSGCVNYDGKEPTVPQHGILTQSRLQGSVESTQHYLYEFGKTGYPATLNYVFGSGGHQAYIQPLYGYEQDYKIGNNGYVQAYSDYEWSTDLPGAYRDTRASDGSGTLDFTIGSLYTWLLNAGQIYHIRTVVLAPRDAGVNASTARLTAQVLPNDGSFHASTAAAGGGCSFLLDPSGGNHIPNATSANFAWCTGVGHGAGSQKAAYSYISTGTFAIRASGTCYDYTLRAGYTPC